MKRGKAPQCLSQFHLDDNPETFPRWNQEEMTHFLTQHPNIWEPTERRHTNTHNTESCSCGKFYFYQSGRARLCHTAHKVGKLQQGREGGRRWRAVREQSGSVLPADDLQVKGRTQSVLCAHTVRCSCISPSIAVGMIIQPKYFQWPLPKSGVYVNNYPFFSAYCHSVSQCFSCFYSGVDSIKDIIACLCGFPFSH